MAGEGIPDCVFCRIAAREAPCYKLYEDNFVIVVLDIKPISEGHALIIVKQHYPGIQELPEELAMHAMKITKHVAAAYKQLGVTDVNILNASGKAAQQSVMHFHLHIVPRKPNDDLDLWFRGDRKAQLAMLDFQEKVKAILKSKI